MAVKELRRYQAVVKQVLADRGGQPEEQGEEDADIDPMDVLLRDLAK